MTAAPTKSKRMVASFDWLWPVFFAMLGLLATLAFRATCQTQPYVIVIDILILAGLLGLMVVLNRRSGEGGKKITISVQLLTGLIVVWPLLTAYLTRWFGVGDPWEVTLLCVLQNAALACAVLSQRPRLGQFAVIFSGFLMLFLGFVLVSPAMTALLAVFGVAVLWWLMEQYWSRAQAALPVAARRMVPLRRSTLVGAVGLLTLVSVAMFTVAPRDALVQLSGYMPTSGGDRWGDRFARDGSGSGEILTGAVQNATTIAPVDTNVFLSSQQPSLYDMISRAYGKPPKHYDKKIAVEGANKDIHLQEKMQELTASRQFSTIRKYAAEAREHQRRKSDALLFVSGRRPLHLRLQTFDRFHGSEWLANEANESFDFDQQEIAGESWFRLNRPTSDAIFKSYAVHELQFVNLRTNRIPTHPTLVAWRIPQIERDDFFKWGRDDVLEMPGRDRIPATTKVGIMFRSVDRWGLHQHRDWPTSLTEGDAKPEFGLNLIPANLRELPRSMLQLEGIENFLRSHFDHAPEVTAPEETDDIVRFFVETGRGPDYMFATTAALWLRDLGYRTRLAQGLIARPEHYDRETKLTIIWPSDVHTWVEVCLDGVNWIPLEPTPGYPLPERESGWLQAMSLWFDAASRWTAQQWWLLALAGLSLLGVWWQRTAIYDALSGIAWRVVRSAVSPRRALAFGERIVRRRLWLAGASCPPTKSLRAWFHSHRSLATVVPDDVWSPFVADLDRLHYAPRFELSAVAAASVLQDCDRILEFVRAHKIAAVRRTRGSARGELTTCDPAVAT